MAFSALSTTNHLHSHAVIFFVFNVLVKFLINAVKFVAIAFVVVKLNIGSSVTVYTPAHT